MIPTWRCKYMDIHTPQYSSTIVLRLLFESCRRWIFRSLIVWIWPSWLTSPIRLLRWILIRRWRRRRIHPQRNLIPRIILRLIHMCPLTLYQSLCGGVHKESSKHDKPTVYYHSSYVVEHANTYHQHPYLRDHTRGPTR
jgi:hypothetical protein